VHGGLLEYSTSREQTCSRRMANNVAVESTDSGTC
jgi:hypothetical protein